MDIEIRTIVNEDSEVRIMPNSRKITGRCIVFLKESRNLGGFTEIILPEAIQGVIDKSDVFAYLNHDKARGVLARSDRGAGSLTLQPDERGLNYTFVAPAFGLGDELIENIKRGDIKGSSFAFSIAKGGDKWEKKSDGTALRIINKFEVLYDVSPCYNPAYVNTDVALRSLDEVKKEEIIEITSTIHGEDLENILTKETLKESEPEQKVEPESEPVVEELTVKGEDLNITVKNNLETLEILEPELKVEPEAKPVTVEPVIEPIAVREEPIVEEPVIEQRNINLIHTNMTIVELKDLKATCQEENDKIFEAKTEENRTMTEKEEAITALNNQKVKEYNLQIENETRKSVPGIQIGGGGGFPYINIGTDEEEFSLIKAIRAKVDQRELPGVAKKLFIRGRNQFRDSGVNAMGDIVIPSVEYRANPILAGTATKGQEIVSEDKKAILPPLVDKLVFTQAGATYLTGLVGNVSIPSYAGTTVGWKTEIAGADELEGLFSEVNFSPLRLTAYLLVSKLFLAQDGVGAERLLLDNISNAVARQLEKTILGPDTNLAGSYPQGIGYMINNANATKKTVLTGATITYAKMVGLETAVDTANALAGNLAYITNSKGRGILKSIDKGTSNDTGDMLCSEDNKVNGYPLLVTNSIVSTYGTTPADGNLVVFGNWADLCIAQWGGYDITVDPYTAADTNQVKIVINSYFDAKGLRGDGGTLNADLNQYMYSFACESVK